MSRILLVAALLLAGGCRCKSEPSATSPVTDKQLEALLAQKPNDGCTTFQVVDGPNGQKSLECVQSDAGR